MSIVEFVVLPIVVIAALAGAIVCRRGSRQRARLTRWLAIVIVDIAAWILVTRPPVGPHLLLALALVVLHFGLAMAAIKDLTGFSAFSSRRSDPGAGRYRSVRPGPGFRPGD